MLTGQFSTQMIGLEIRVDVSAGGQILVHQATILKKTRVTYLLM